MPAAQGTAVLLSRDGRADISQRQHTTKRRFPMLSTTRGCGGSAGAGGGTGFPQPALLRSVPSCSNDERCCCEKEHSKVTQPVPRIPHCHAREHAADIMQLVLEPTCGPATKTRATQAEKTSTVNCLRSCQPMIRDVAATSRASNRKHHMNYRLSIGYRGAI